ncbi:MAG: DUF3604 domain-containing protein [Candidatus Bathyarchaeota archaeon]|nr:DUF3604 domain-containing protein [Candidatus Bathyarchaeota archaeon]
MELNRMDLDESLSTRRIPKVPTRAVAFMVTAPSLLAPNEEFEVNIAAIRVDGYPDVDFKGKVRIKSTDGDAWIKKNLSFGKADRGTHRLADVKLATPGVHRIEVQVESSDLKGVSNPIKCSDERREYDLYWGDLHLHNPSHNPRLPPIEIAESIEFGCRFGRQVSNVDFCGVTDHAYILDEEKWQITRQKIEENNRSGEFVTFLGFESSHRTEKGGDENVHFLQNGKFRNFLPDDGSLEDLWRWLKQQCHEFMTVPHHTARISKARDWSMNYYGGPQHEPVYEVYSKWGASEFRGNPRSIFSGASDSKVYFQDALNCGYRFGVVGGGDEHHTTPGRRCSNFARRFSSGLAAIYAKNLTRRDLWEALKKKRCFATSLNRILIDFRIDNHSMGEEVQSRNPEIMAEACGVVPFVKVEVVKNGEVLYRHKVLDDWPGGKTSGARKARTSKVNFSLMDRVESVSYYYLRVIQRNGEMAWSSPIWVAP